MNRYIVGTDRSQVTLFPDRLEDWIDEDMDWDLNAPRRRRPVVRVIILGFC
jgi:hypothetical protein